MKRQLKLPLGSKGLIAGSLQSVDRMIRSKNCIYYNFSTIYIDVSKEALQRSTDCVDHRNNNVMKVVLKPTYCLESYKLSQVQQYFFSPIFVCKYLSDNGSHVIL